MREVQASPAVVHVYIRWIIVLAVLCFRSIILATLKNTHVGTTQSWDLHAHVTLRAPDFLFHRLTKEENAFKEFALSGALRSTRIFDVIDAQIMG
jgi:hypothetical protein